MPKVTLYSRPGCGLCDEVKREIEAFRGRAAFELREINIDEHPELRERYGEHVPVVAIDGEEVSRHRLDARKFLQALGSAS